MDNDGLSSQGAHHEAEGPTESDDFSIQPLNADRYSGEAERRLHLLAYDYWIALRGLSDAPNFRDLTPEGIRPFRRSALLLDFGTEGSSQVRFAGDSIAALLSDIPVTPGTDFSTLSDAPLAAKLLTYLKDRANRREAREFSYSDARVYGRGAILPLDRTAGDGAFALVVTSFDLQPGVADPALGGTSAPEPTQDLQESLRLARSHAAASPGLSASGRQALYRALQAAYGFYKNSLSDRDGYIALLKEAGIRRQSRAPFTPALKLVFGKDYDKTRLTEYAAALAEANARSIRVDGLVKFLGNMPGGIKGCVAAQRSAKRGESGTDITARVAALDALGRVDGLDLDGPTLVLARPSAHGTGADIVAPVSLSAAQLQRLIKQVLKASESEA